MVSVGGLSLGLRKFLTSKDLGAKLARVGVGLGAVGAGVGGGAILATSGISQSTKEASKVFGIDKTMLFIVGVVILLVVLLAVGKR